MPWAHLGRIFTSAGAGVADALAEFSKIPPSIPGWLSLPPSQYSQEKTALDEQN